MRDFCKTGRVSRRKSCSHPLSEASLGIARLAFRGSLGLSVSLPDLLYY